MECSGGDADYFEPFKGIGRKPCRAEEAMILSAGEFTGVPLAAVGTISTRFPQVCMSSAAGPGVVVAPSPRWR
jgi:hypothetical protein